MLLCFTVLDIQTECMTYAAAVGENEDIKPFRKLQVEYIPSQEKVSGLFVEQFVQLIYRVYQTCYAQKWTMRYCSEHDLTILYLSSGAVFFVPSVRHVMLQMFKSSSTQLEYSNVFGPVWTLLWKLLQNASAQVYRTYST